MNILPLIFTFLILFSCLAATFLEKAKSASIIEIADRGYDRAQRALNNSLVRKSYSKIKQQKTEEAQKKQTQNKPYYSLRSLFPPLENSKFNLSALIDEQNSAALHPLYEPFAELLRLQYGKLWKGDKTEYRLIDAILKKGKALPNAENLEEFYPDDPELKKIYYKMLKGTNQYGRHEGIPPLRSLLSIKKERKSLCMRFAAPVLLEAFFGIEIASEILEAEQIAWETSNKRHPLSNEEIKDKINVFADKREQLNSLESYLDFSKNFIPREEAGGRDKITGVSVKTKLK